MTDCTFCGRPVDGEDEKDQRVHIHASNGAVICSGCTTCATGMIARQEELAKIAFDYAVKKRGAGIQKDENGDCVCPGCTFQRLRAADKIYHGIIAMAPFNKAEEIPSVKH